MATYTLVTAKLYEQTNKKMKIEKKINKISISELIKLMLFMFVLSYGLFFLLLILTGKTIYHIKYTTGGFLIINAIISAVIQTSINRNSILKLTDFDNPTNTIKNLESIILKSGYSSVKLSIEDYKYDKKTRLGRLFGLIVDEKIELKIINNEIFAYMKSRMIDKVESELFDLEEKNKKPGGSTS